MKSKWYIKERSYFLKDCHNFWRNAGHFSKKNEYAVGFDSEADAEQYLKDRIQLLTLESNLEDAETRYKNGMDLWIDGKIKREKACRMMSMRFEPHLQYCPLHDWDWNTNKATPHTKAQLLEAMQYHVSSDEAEYKLKVLERILKAEVVSEELKIEFIKNHKNNIQWHEEREEVSGHNDKGYCQCCGVRVPGMKYLIIPSTHKSSRICAFCVGRFAEEVKPILNDIDADLVKEYKQEHFMVKL